MTSTLSKPRSPAERRTRLCSATICSKACSRAPALPPISRSSRNSRPATTSALSAITAGRAATGNCCPGFSVARRSKPGERATNAVPAVGRWKMLDNLRRTLSAPAAVLALLAGWTLSFHAALIWTLFVVLTIVLPTLIPVVAAIPPRRPGVTMSSHVRALGGDFRLALTLSTLTITFLADQAWLMADAIGRTLWRLGVTRRHLLEWVPAAQATIGPRLDLMGLTRRMAARSSSAPSQRLSLWRSAMGRGPWRFLSPRCGSLRRPSRVGQPTPGAAAQLADVRRRRRGAEANRAPHLAVLRDVRHAGRQHAAARQFSGQPDAGDRASDVADQSRPLSPFRRQRARFRLDRDRPGDRSARGDAGDDEPACNAFADISTIGTTRAICARSTRDTCPPSTAAIWPGILSRWRTRAGNGGAARLTAQRRLDGVADALEITRAESARLRDGGQTQTVTWQPTRRRDRRRGARLAAGAASQRRSCRAARGSPADAEIMVDIAGALAIERGDGSGADMLFWAQATLNAIEAHRHDLAQSASAARSAAARLSTWKRRRGRWRWRWTLVSCSTAAANCCRSDFSRRKARSIRIATICWLPRRGSPASSPSPKATSPPSTGSGSAAPRRRSRMAPR